MAEGGDPARTPGSAHPAVHAASWHGASADEWRERWGVPDLRIFRSVGSTNDVARALAEAGVPAGSVVLAEEQTAGRGRRGRAWRAAPGRSLMISFVLRPPGGEAAVLPLRIGLAAARAIQEEAGVRALIKWPNDLVARGRKLGGILCEGAMEGGTPAWVVAGIGLNVLQEESDWDDELRGAAVSVAALAGRPVSMSGLAGRLVSEVSIAAAERGTVLTHAEQEELAERDALRGRRLVVDGDEGGRAMGIDPDGALLLQRDGAVHRILAATVRPATDDQTRSDA